MAVRVIIGLTLLAAVVLAVVPDVGMMAMLPLLLVVLGLAYGVMAVDAENATNYLVFVIAVGAAGGADALSYIPAVGGYLDGIVDGVASALNASVAAVLAVWAFNRVKG
jgi:hypothetical protein